MWQVSISTSAEAEDAVACFLERVFGKPASIYYDEATGARGVFVHPARLTQSPQVTRKILRAGLKEIRGYGLKIGPGKIMAKPLPRENWAESWKRHFKPIEIEDRLLIKPGWSRRRAKPGQRVVILDPGLSFGTGHHPTTAFCLRQLVQCRQTDRRQSFIDVGTGTGILAIAAAKLGYSPVEAFDNDPAAVRVSRQNARRNRVWPRVRPRLKDLSNLGLRPVQTYDVMCANLAHGVLLKEAPKLAVRLKPGGKLIIAGLLRRQFREIAKMLRRFGLTSHVKRSEDCWSSGQFVLK